MKFKRFTSKIGYYPVRTLIACILIITVCLSLSIGLSYSRLVVASEPVEASFTAPSVYIHRTDSETTYTSVFAAESGDTVIESLDGRVKVTIPENTVSNHSNSHPEAYILRAKLKSYTYDYTKSENQFTLTYLLQLFALYDSRDEHGLAKDNNKNIKIEIDADDDVTNVSASFSDPSMCQSFVYNADSKKFVSTKCKAINFDVSISYDVAGWNNYADTSWYDPAGTTFSINSGAQLAGLAELVNDGTEDFSGKTVMLTDNISLYGGEMLYAPGVKFIRYWTPIGTAEHPFKGNFDGCGFTISGLNVANYGSVGGSDCGIGLFGKIVGSSSRYIRDLTVDTASLAADIYIDPADYISAAGTIVGIAEGYSFSGLTLSTCDYSCGTAEYQGAVVGYCYADTGVDDSDAGYKSADYSPYYLANNP